MIWLFWIHSFTQKSTEVSIKCQISSRGIISCHKPASTTPCWSIGPSAAPVRAVLQISPNTLSTMSMMLPLIIYPVTFDPPPPFLFCSLFLINIYKCNHFTPTHISCSQCLYTNVFTILDVVATDIDVLCVVLFSFFLQDFFFVSIFSTHLFIIHTFLFYFHYLFV